MKQTWELSNVILHDSCKVDHDCLEHLHLKLAKDASEEEETVVREKPNLGYVEGSANAGLWAANTGTDLLITL